MADSKKYNGSTWEHSLRKLATATDTFTTLPVDVYADGNNATVGISGNTVQSGTPTPDNPIMPEGTGDRTENLFDKNATNVNNGYITNGFLGSDGSITTNIFYHVSEYIRIAQNQSYTLFYGSNLNLPSVCFYDSAKNYISGIAYAGQWSVLFTAPQNAEYLRLSFRTVDPSSIMLNLGSKALPYEPYGIKIPISSASTTTPVYLGEVQSTRRIKELVLTGEENWTKNDVGNPSNYLYYQTGYSANKTCVCSHLADMGTLSTSKVGVFNANNVLYLNFGADVMNAQPSGNTVAGMKEYLAAQYANGTPVTIWYVLATPQTAIVNEPIRKIGDYADTVSSITVPMITGRDTFDVETTLKPSEASLSYTGWHDATVQEWDGSQWNE